MVLHDDSSFRIYFGAAKDSCVKAKWTYSINCFENIRRNLHLDKLIFLKQVHSSQGICIDSPSQIKETLSLFEQEGDFIITNQRNIGIGVVAADCLPVAFYDPVHHIAAIAHIGWRGAISEIVSNIIHTMQKTFKIRIPELIVYFGPSAKVCCYKVQPDFLKDLETSVFVDQVIWKKDESLFFNLPRLVKLQLISLGVKSANINKDYKYVPAKYFNF